MTTIQTIGPSSQGDRKPSKAEDAIIQTIMFTMMATPLVIMMTVPEKVTPDLLYAWGSTPGGSLAIMGIGWSGALLSIMVAGWLVLKHRDVLLATLIASISWVSMIYSMGVYFETNDYDGERNPYVRAQTIEESRYSDLAALRRYPAVAAEIRRAAADGRITKGEAYDIEHGRALSDARSREYEARTARDRAAVLGS